MKERLGICIWLLKENGGDEDSERVLKSVTSFVGGGGPRFWSTFTPQLMQNNYAELLLEVYDKDFTPELIGPLQAAMDAEVPGAIVQVRQLQTNPVAYPVSIEISGDHETSFDPPSDVGIRCWCSRTRWARPSMSASPRAASRRARR